MTTHKPASIMTLNGGDELAIVRCRQPDDDMFWKLVFGHSTEEEYRYGLAEDVDPDEICQPAREPNGWREYDDELLMKWLKTHIKPPEWRWWRWNVLSPEDRDMYDGSTMTLAGVPGPGPGRWHGAVVELVDADAEGEAGR